MAYIFYFSTSEDAKLFVDRALEIAKEYNYVSFSDLCDLTGECSDYKGNFFGWTSSCVSCKVYTIFITNIKKYVVSFPEPDFHKNTNCSTSESPRSYKDFYNQERPRSYIVKKDIETSPEPLGITIYTATIANPLAVVHEVIDIGKQIKDRPVFITIS